VKTLPDRPNLDHLRRQAKDLLAGLRESEPATSLAQAQALLAGQYGFHSWTELKAEVDRLRGGPAEVADEATARAVAARFGLGEVTGPMRSVVRSDNVGQRWSLHTDRGGWTVRTIAPGPRIVDVETEVGLQIAAAGAGIALPAPVRSRTGNIVESIDNHQWRVNEEFPSGPPLVAPASAEVNRAVGGILATVHRLALPVDRLSPWHARPLRPMPWRDLARTAIASGAEWAALLDDAVPTLERLETVGADDVAPAPVLCHNTFGPAQVRHADGGRLAVVGWEYAGGQPPSWELCGALVDWAIGPDGVNVTCAHAMLRGYEQVAGSIPPLSMASFRGAAMNLANYAAEQVQQALDARPGDERRLAERSVRHLLTGLGAGSRRGSSGNAYEQLLGAVRPVTA
jgi:Ser/Thr protein kinase RdoA (MazF antagonist)